MAIYVIFVRAVQMIVTKEFAYLCRAVARSENLGWHVLLGGDNVPPLVEIGLPDLPKRPPHLRRACYVNKTYCITPKA
jgi:hypothetical protein